MNANLPLVTAVLVCWNHEHFVRASILAAVRQTYPNIQLIVFDNDSSDGSRKIIEPLAEEYGFTFIHQPNVGLVRTLNRGLEMAYGKYFTLLATDDVWLLDKIERQVGFMEKEPDVDMVCGNIVMIDQDNQLTGIQASHRQRQEVTFKYLMEVGNAVQGSTVMMRTQALLDEGGYDEKIRVEDFSLALKFANHGRRIAHTGELYTLYRRHDNNWTSRPLFEELREIGRAYRATPEYRCYIRRSLKGYFRKLASENKKEAIRLLFSEPIAWSFSDVGVGLIKMLVPNATIRAYRKLHRANAC